MSSGRLFLNGLLASSGIPDVHVWTKRQGTGCSSFILEGSRASAAKTVGSMVFFIPTSSVVPGPVLNIVMTEPLPLKRG
jgi:hypothetical protein